jgi:hypothetical protein
MLERVTEDIWFAARPLRFMGLETGTRMTVVRLEGGGLLVHSPVALDASLRDAVDALGRVQAVVAPSLFHHLYAGEWANAYPEASLLACPGLERKRKDLRWSGVLVEEPPAEWKGQLDQVFFGAFAMSNEIVFFHRKSRTIITSDLVFNLSTHPSWVTRAAARMIATREPGVTLLERVLIRDHGTAREQIARMVAWDAQRIVLAHGDIVAADGSKVLEKAYRWL